MSELVKGNQNVNQVANIPDTKELAKYLDLFGYSEIPQKEKELF